MTTPSPTTRRAWRRYFEALARSERALRRAERALDDVAMAAGRLPNDADAATVRSESVAGALTVGRLRRRLVTAGDGRGEGSP